MKTNTQSLYLRRLVAATGVAAICTAISLTSLAQNAPGIRNDNSPIYRPGEVIVQFKAAATDAEVADALAAGELEVRRHVQTPAMGLHGNPGLTHALTRLPVEQAVQLLQRHPAVEFAEANWIYTHQLASNDPYYTQNYLWGMYGDLSSPANAYGSQAAEAWSAGFIGSRDVYVGIIDEGVQITHPDLAPNVWTNPFDPVDGMDNDQNGHTDDVHGWDFLSNENTVYDSTGDDHGTHVAGTIAGAGGNAAGVAGVNWAVTFIPAKFLGATGGSTLDAIEAIDYFVDLKQRHGLNLVALNNSWGGGGYSQALHDAIIRAAKANILFVAAAGNGDRLGNGLNNDTTPNYPSNYDTTQGTSTATPASYDAVIAVAAIDQSGNRAQFSNYGVTQVDLGAPGVSIYSTLPGDTYGGYSGTSMATPHVTGAAALYASTHPGATPQEIRNALLSSVTGTPSLAGATVTGGRLNLSTIIDPNSAPPPTVSIPAAPGNLTASTANRQVTLRWTDNSTNESGFQVEYAANNGAFQRLGTTGPNITSVTVSGLNRNTTYRFRVRAFNAAGNSDYSNTVSARPR